VPIRSPDGRALAALGVSAASERMDAFQRMHGRLLHKMASKLERAIADDLTEGDLALQASPEARLMPVSRRKHTPRSTVSPLRQPSVTAAM